MAEERRPRVEHIPDRPTEEMAPTRAQISAVSRAARTTDPGPETIRDLAMDSAACLVDLKETDAAMSRELRAHGERIVDLESALQPLTMANRTLLALRSSIAWAVGTVAALVPLYLAAKSLGWL